MLIHFYPRSKLLNVIILQVSDQDDQVSDQDEPGPETPMLRDSYEVNILWPKPRMSNGFALLNDACMVVGK